MPSKESGKGWDGLKSELRETARNFAALGEKRTVEPDALPDATIVARTKVHSPPVAMFAKTESAASVLFGVRLLNQNPPTAVNKKIEADGNFCNPIPPGNFCWRTRNLFPLRLGNLPESLKKPAWHSRCLASQVMDVSLYQAAAAMNATAQWQDLITENLANSAVPGSRKQEISFSDVQAGIGSGIPSASTVTNFKTGELCSTGNAMDFALEGKGFFTVQLPNGESAYTRNGEFKLNAKGQLVNNEGFAVLGSNGPLQFNPNSSDAITVSATGEVSQGSEAKGKLQITEFQHPENLMPIGTADFQSDAQDAQPVAAVSTQVRQGFIEAANTSPTTEMASLITAMRMFESNQKVLQMQSDRMSKVITELTGTT
jgi:flagellar basal body rod protein FlgG